MLRSALGLTCALVACSSAKVTTTDKHDFSDAAGRICQATLARTSPTSPPVSESVSCEAGAKQCSAESEPCFELSIDSVSYEIRNCPACCRGSASSFTAADCSALVCATAGDCVYTQSQCVDGFCQCPTGNCE
jgi:hypothetical protein